MVEGLVDVCYTVTILCEGHLQMLDFSIKTLCYWMSEENITFFRSLINQSVFLEHCPHDWHGIVVPQIEEQHALFCNIY